MNKSSSWLHTQLVGKTQPSGGASCCYLCGASCSETHTVARGLADTFNSHYLALCPSSPSLCAACQWYFDGKAAHPDFRKMSIIVAEHVWCQWDRTMMKSDITQWLACGLDVDAYLVVSLSKKKHILLQAPLNTQGSHHLSIQVEEQVAHVDVMSWDSIHTPFMSLMQLGHGKGEILGGVLYGATLKRHGQVARAVTLSAQLAPWRHSPLIGLISYVTLVEDR